MKKTSLSQIPGFSYSSEQISQVPKPIQWLNQAMNESISASITLKKLNQESFVLAKEESMLYDAKKGNPLWKKFVEYAE